MRFGRRVGFAVAVMAAQLLLVATAIAWCVHMLIIKKRGEVYFVEPNSAILHAELILTVLVIIFAVTGFAVQWKRLGERRSCDDRETGIPR